MRRLLLLFSLAAIGFTACQKEELDNDFTGATEGSALRLKIDLSAAKPASRAVEGGHNSETPPRVYSITVYAYNEFKVATQIDIVGTELGKVIKGNYIDANGAPQTGTAGTVGGGMNIGLPAGTKNVDVVLNNPSSKYTDISENINYYNHREDDKWITGQGADQNYYGKNNFDRVFLTTDKYGTGYSLTGNDVDMSTDGAGLPLYTFKNPIVVKPALARFEIHGAINVSKEAVWVDKFNVKWKSLAKADNASEYEKILKEKDQTTGVFYYEMVKDRNKEIMYIPEHYWDSDLGQKTVFVSVTGNWKDNTFYNTADAKPVNWLPNAFYAVDVEEIYVNNILVRTPTASPFKLPWPGADDATHNWPNWYKAYHTDGWHSAGISADNSFLCLSNMWDRIATAATTGGSMENVNWNGLVIPHPSGSGAFTMQVIKGKAAAITNTSSYADAQSSRNLGVASGKAAAYMFYPQSAKQGSTTPDALKSELPHVILKVKCYKSAVDYAAGKAVTSDNFITLQLFSLGAGNTQYITDFQRGKIYRLDLNNLVSAFVGDAPFEGTEGDKVPTIPVDPDPEMPGSKLVMEVSVLPWTVENMYPVVK